MEKRTGGCHCKAVRYEVEIDLSKPVLECNCSHCQVKGLLLAFVPASAMHIVSGEDNLTEYRFNTEKLQHLFCKTCGVQSFARGEKDGAGTYGINVRTIDDIDLSALTRIPYDGKNR
jgi:hypothetical protein